MNDVKEDPLYQLIHSMDKKEKRYFKLFANKYNRKKNTNALVLFDIIAKQKKYNQTTILKKLKKHDIYKNFAFEKHKLYSLVLKSLSECNSNYSTRVQTLEILKQIEILFGRTLFQQAQKLIQKGLKLIEGKNLFDLEFQLNEWDTLLVKQIKGERNLQSYWKQLRKRRVDLIDNLQNENEFIEILSDVFELHIKGQTISNDWLNPKLKEILENPLFETSKNAKTLKAKCNYFSIQALIYYTLQDYNTASIFYEKEIDLFEGNPLFLEENFKGYSVAMYNYTALLIGQNDLEKATQYLNIYKELPKRNPELFKKSELVYHKQKALSLELTYNNDFCFFEASLDKADEVNKMISSLNHKRNRYDHAVMYHYIILAFFAEDKFEKAEIWIEKYIEKFDNELRSDIQFLIRILLTMIHFELKNYTLMPRYINNLIYYSNKYKFKGTFSKAIIQLLKKISKEPNKVKAYSQDCLDIIGDYDDSVASVVKTWLVYTIEGKKRSFGTIFRET